MRTRAHSVLCCACDDRSRYVRPLCAGCLSKVGYEVAADVRTLLVSARARAGRECRRTAGNAVLNDERVSVVGRTTFVSEHGRIVLMYAGDAWAGRGRCTQGAHQGTRCERREARFKANAPLHAERTARRMDGRRDSTLIACIRRWGVRRWGVRAS